jgi:nucleotide-binding universal stress UspA family protein
VEAPSIADMTELLVPLDGSGASERSVPVAGRLAERLNLGVRLFSVGGDPDALSAVAEHLLPGVNVDVEVGATGDVVGGIVDAAGKDRVVCMATAASLLPHKGHVGSVAEGVVRSIGRPVFMVGPHMEPSPGEYTQRVIAPVDGSHLSEASLDVAGDLARALDVPIWVVTSVPQKAEAKARASMAGDFAAGQSGYVLHLARDLAKRFGVDAEYEVLHVDDPAKSIVDFAGDDGTIVMATHGRSGMSRVFGGSVATAVVAHSPRAVMVWRPPESE